MPDRDALLAFEGQVDAAIQDSPLLRLPRRSVLTMIYLIIHQCFHGDLMGSENGDPEVGAAIINRLSLVAHLLLRCPIEPFGADAGDAMSPFEVAPELTHEVIRLFTYGHFSELMPEVRRGYYEVHRLGPSNFELVHSNELFTHFEEVDTLLSEVAIPFFATMPEPSEELVESAFQLDDVTDADSLIELYAAAFAHTYLTTHELPLLSDAGYQSIIGVSFDQFRRFQASWAAWTHVAYLASERFRRAIVEQGGPDENRDLHTLWLEWIAVNFTTEFLESACIPVSGLDVPTFRRLASLYTLSADSKPGDGFFPPLLRHRKSTFFNPDTLRTMLSGRNLVYATLRGRENEFSAVAGNSLEPRLLADATTQLNHDPSLVIVQNCNWSSGSVAGEIDLLVYDRNDNVALHIQAKGTIPPHGAKLTRNLESQILGGLNQLARLRDLPLREKDRIIGEAIQTEVANVEGVDVLLARSSFGTIKVWGEMGRVVACSLPVLAGATRKLLQASGRIPLSTFSEAVAQTIEDIRTDCHPQWSTWTMELDGTGITIPLLNLDPKGVQCARLRLFPETV